MGWGGRWEGGSGWGTHVNPWLIHVNVWQKPLQYCKVMILQLIKINEKKRKKVGKTTRPFRYDLNKIPYDYTVEVRNKFKGLDLIDCLMNYGWRFMTLYRRQDKDHPPEKRNAKKQNGCLRGSTNSCEKKRSEKERYIHLNAEFQRIARR